MIFDVPIVKRLQLAEGSDDGLHFSVIEYFFIKVCTLIFLGMMLLHT